MTNKNKKIKAEGLSPSQQNALDAVRSEENVFITGGAGTGKTYLINAICKGFTEQNKKVLLCAPTGITALNIHGVTIHCAFGLTGSVFITPKKHKISSRAPYSLNDVSVVIIDEISMVRCDLFESICTSIKKVEQRTQKKIQIILVGDFFQLPPVIERGSPDERLLKDYYGNSLGNGFAFATKSWRELQLKVVILNEGQRQKHQEFIYNLNKIRIGDYSGCDYFNKNCAQNPIENAITICAHNRDVEEYNNKKLSQLPAPQYEFVPFIHNIHHFTTF